MPKQILLVEDSSTMQKVVEITFAHEDYRIVATRSADEALHHLRDNPPDVILADASLPGRSGYDLAAAVKSDAATREIPVLLLTGNFNPYDEARGQKAGVDGALIKPFETQVLIDKVADLLRRRGQSGIASSTPTVTNIAPPQIHVGHVGNAGYPVGAPASTLAVTAQDGGSNRRPTIPPMPPPRISQAMPQIPHASQAGGSRPPGDANMQRSTLMGIPAVNPLGASGFRPPPPPGMRVRETGNMPAINPQAPAVSGAPQAAPQMPSWSMRQPEVSRPVQAAQAPITASPLANTVYGTQSPYAPAPSAAVTAPGPNAHTQGTAGAGIPANVPTMPRPPLIPRAPVPAPVLAALERIAARGAEYEVIAKLSMETIEQIAWEVIPELAEVYIRAELDRLIKERQGKP